MAKQASIGKTTEEFIAHSSAAASSAATSSATQSCSEECSEESPRILKLDLLTLPQFNVTYIARCLSVHERLTTLARIHKRFRDFLLQPQCFPDMSFFPVDDPNLYAPKIMSTNTNISTGTTGITYVQINIWSKHAFIQRVAMLAGMWNFKADLWNQMEWPLNVNIESLQLTLDYTSCVDCVHLDFPPQQNITLNGRRHGQHSLRAPSVAATAAATTSTVATTNTDDDLIEEEISESAAVSDEYRTPYTSIIHEQRPRVLVTTEAAEMVATATTSTAAPQQQQEQRVVGEMSASSSHWLECISPTTRKPMELKSKLRNLFFIKYDSSYHQPKVHFPRTLWGLGLQAFNSSIFARTWWVQQIKIEQRFESLRFLVLSCCDFQEDEFQTLLENTRNLEHLSVRFVKWEGTIYFPPSLLSLGYFPDRHLTGYFSVKQCAKLWQISTRMNENEEASIDFLNACLDLASVKRVKFEFIRRQQYADSDVDLNKLEVWKHTQEDTAFTVAINEEELTHYPILREVFPIPPTQFINIEHIKFEDCPFWSDESKDFIHMTNKRKLLLR